MVLGSNPVVGRLNFPTISEILIFNEEKHCFMICIVLLLLLILAKRYGQCELTNSFWGGAAQCTNMENTSFAK